MSQSLIVVAFINEQNEADARIFSDAEYAQEVFEELRAEDCAPELFTRIIEE